MRNTHAHTHTHTRPTGATAALGPWHSRPPGLGAIWPPASASECGGGARRDDARSGDAARPRGLARRGGHLHRRPVRRSRGVCQRRDMRRRRKPADVRLCDVGDHARRPVPESQQLGDACERHVVSARPANAFKSLIVGSVREALLTPERGDLRRVRRKLPRAVLRRVDRRWRRKRRPGELLELPRQRRTQQRRERCRARSRGAAAHADGQVPRGVWIGGAFGRPWRAQGRRGSLRASVGPAASRRDGQHGPAASRRRCAGGTLLRRARADGHVQQQPGLRRHRGRGKARRRAGDGRRAPRGRSPRPGRDGGLLRRRGAREDF